MVKNFFPISNLNLPSFTLRPFPLVLSLHTLVKSPSPSFLLAPSGTGSCSKVGKLTQMLLSQVFIPPVQCRGTLFQFLILCRLLS